MKYIEYKGIRYKYKDIITWEEFIKVADEPDETKVLEWYVKYVFVDKPKDYNVAKLLSANLKYHLGHTSDEVKQLRKNAAKIIRGIEVPECQYKSILFNLMYELKISYTELNSMDWKDIIFFNAMLQEIHRLENEANERARKKAESKTKRR